MINDLNLSEKILFERRKRNLTQEELGIALGVSAQAISNWERGGYPDITMLPGIANYFKISVDELLGNDTAGQKEDIRQFFDRYFTLVEKHTLTQNTTKGNSLVVFVCLYLKYSNDADQL
jgi:transcriptional regulator with XRE-family HTH domain